MKKSERGALVAELQQLQQHYQLLSRSVQAVVITLEEAVARLNIVDLEINTLIQRYQHPPMKKAPEHA